ncbi:MAG TPA: MerR family transcriptional regulator [Thermoanaerobaculia bacterium]
MVTKARVQKRLYYKIGEACKALGIQPYVLRYWETEFPALAPSKSRSGQRVYSEKELEIIRRIKELLYEEGYTIAGAKKKLETELASGSLGEEGIAESEAEGAPEPPVALPITKAAKTPKAVNAPPAAPPRAEAEEPSTLDTETAERVQRLRSGIEKALQEAREILALLDSKPS